MLSKIRIVPALITAALLSFVFSGVAAGQMPMVYIPLGQPSNAVNTGGFTGGALFQRAADAGPITFNSLGFIDLHTVNPTLQGPDGISGTYQVSLWRVDTYTLGPVVPTSWTLMGSTTITPASPLGSAWPGGGMSDTFRYNWIPAATINAGEYFIIGATLPTGPLPDTYLNGTNPSNATGITGAGSGYILSGGNFSPAVSPLYIANANTLSIPEPASLSLLAMGCLTMLRRRRA